MEAIVNSDAVVRRLPTGELALLDATDYEQAFSYQTRLGEFLLRPCDYSWSRVGSPKAYYVGFNFSRRNRSVTCKLHRLVAEAAIGVVIDHKNHNRFDNRRDNLRVATSSENCSWTQRLKRSKSGTSLYRGVYPYGNGRWRAQTTINRKRTHLGLFATEVEAAIAYDRAATEHFGAFARLNFPLVQGGAQ